MISITKPTLSNQNYTHSEIEVQIIVHNQPFLVSLKDLQNLKTNIKDIEEEIEKSNRNYLVVNYSEFIEFIDPEEI